MSLKTITRALLAAVVVVTAGHLLSVTDASAGLRDIRLLDQTGCCRRCPACDHECKLDAEQVEEEKPCFDVESKVICIPRVVFPWQRKKCDSCDSCDGRGCSHCVHNGAKTRRICVLKTDSYKCPKCKYTWSAVKTGCDSACDAGYTSTSTESTPAFKAFQTHVYDFASSPGSESVKVKTSSWSTPARGK